MGTYRTLYLVTCRVGGGRGPLSAQAQDGPPLKMVYAVWKSTGGASNTMHHMNKKTYDLVEAYAVLVKDTAGKVEVKQRGNKAGGSAAGGAGCRNHRHRDRKAERAAAECGGFRRGYKPAGGPASHLSDKDLKRVVSMLNPGESAVLLISPQPDVAEVQKFVGMGGQATPEFVVVDLQ